MEPSLVDVVRCVLELVELLDVVFRGGSGGGGVELDEVELELDQLELLLASTKGSNKLSNAEVGLT